jgi:hypothetical protein
MNRAFSIGAAILLILYAVFALAACGGSGGASPCLTLGGFCVPSHTVGGTVSGLEGSGLVLSDGESVAISANGPFTFPTKVQESIMYDVSVSVQPGNPSQTCVVTNGSGVVGNSNVSDISVVCTTGVANANLKGAYMAVRYDYGSTLTGDGGDLWTVTFDGAGNFSGTLVENVGGKVGSGAVAGTYTVATDGTLNISPIGASTITGGLSADGNTWVTSQTNASGEAVMPDVLVGIKQGQANFSNANLKGSYAAVRYDNNSVGDSSGLWTVTFDGAGNFSGTETLNNTGPVSSAAVSGTYRVAADGTLNISPVGGSTITGGLSADGNTLVTSQTSAGVSPEVLVGIKQGPANFSNANLRGTYTAVHYDYGNTGDSGGLWTVTFDGASNFSGTDTLNWPVSSVAVSGTYRVAADGALNVSPTGGSTVTGGLSADGNTWVAIQTASGHSPSIMVGILR